MENGSVPAYFEELRYVERRQGLQTLVHTWLHQVALGLEYLHSEDDVHGDLRGPNSLVDENKNIRLADFGLARLAVSLGDTMTSGNTTNAQWAAPEILDPENFGFDSGRPTKESNIYSFACVCIEMYTCESPFRNFNLSPCKLLMKVVHSDLRPERPNFCVADETMPDELWTLITQSWATNPAERPATTQLVSMWSMV